MSKVASLLVSTALLNIFYLVYGGDDEVTHQPVSEETAKSKDDSYTGDYISSKNIYQILIVLVSVTVITVVFFILKTMSGRKNKKTKKYGVLATSGTDVELRPLDDDDEEDEDVTVFDTNR